MRTFLAIDIPQRYKEIFSDIQNECKKFNPDIKWVEKENLHITIKFFGEISPPTLSTLKQKLNLVSYTPFKLKLYNIGYFPDEKNPRVIWIGIEDNSDSLKKINEVIEKILENLGFEKEKKFFSPHLTIGRVKSKKNFDKLLQIFKKYESVSFGEFDVEKIILYKSELFPTGPVYTKICDFLLKGEPS